MLTLKWAQLINRMGEWELGNKNHSPLIPSAAKQK